MDLDHRFANTLPELALPWRAEPAPDPRLLALNEPLATELGLDASWLRTPEGLRFLLGQDAEDAVAMAYAGHQFGGWSPRLGDGRALLLGDLGGRDLHLKGSGRTPFARGGDGLAAVGPMLREHLISEAMHALGIPTTRSLAVVATGRSVQRETELPGAVLARVASSHLRVGMFSFVAAAGDVDVLRRLADHAIELHCPGASYLGLFEQVLAAQASLVAKWMLVGFVHGVMNTDNTTISGETIDYGPCAFLEAFDPTTVFSSIDTGGRYAYGNQPAALEWNLARLAEALLPLLSDDQDTAIALATAALGTFRTSYADAWATGMAAKLGLPASAPVEPLAQELQRLMHASRADHTSTYRALSALLRGDAEPARGRFLDLAGFDAWVASWRALGPDADAMDRVNPVYVPRNQLVDQALEAATGGDLGPFTRLLEVVTRPYDERPGQEAYAQPAPDEFSSSFQTFCGT